MRSPFWSDASPTRIFLFPRGERTTLARPAMGHGMVLWTYRSSALRCGLSA